MTSNGGKRDSAKACSAEQVSHTMNNRHAQCIADRLFISTVASWITVPPVLDRKCAMIVGPSVFAIVPLGGQSKSFFVI